MQLWIVTLLLVVTLYLLVSERIGIDLTAILIMVVLTLSGILTPGEAVAGFANPAVVTVAAMFVISKGMMRTGAVGLIGQRVIRLSRGSPALATAIVLVIVAVASAFINNTPVVVLFIPVVMSMCCEFGLSPSKLLMPVSYASILAGSCTLIGTSTNILVSDLSYQYGYGRLGMFELSRLGVPIAVLGLLFLLAAAPRLLPRLGNPSCEMRDGARRRYLAELYVAQRSGIIGRPAQDAFRDEHPELEVLELIRGDQIFHPARRRVTIAAGDGLLVKGAAGELVAVLQSGAVELPPSEAELVFGGGRDTMVVELIITPQSRLRGWPISETELARNPDLHIVAIKRSRLHFTEKKVQDVALKTGDVLLVWSPADRLDTLRGRSDFIIVEDVYHQIVPKGKAKWAAVVFAAMVLAAATGMADILTCALSAAFLMTALGCLQMRDAYRALQGDVLLLIAGTIALGAAMEKSGASRVYADAFLSLLAGWSPRLILVGFLLLTSVSTQLLSNNATAVLLLPVAISTAQGLGVDAKPFIMAVCFGASACFATPIGYQTNLLVYGPGGYRFSDYLRLGMPMNALVIVMGGLFIPLLWPF